MVFDILGNALHHKMILGHQTGPWTFSKHHGLLVERPSAKIHLEKYPPQKKNEKNGKLGMPFCLRKWILFECLFIVFLEPRAIVLL